MCKYSILDIKTSNFTSIETDLNEISTESNISFANYKNASVVSTTSNCLAFYSKKTVRLEFGVVLLAQHLGEENITIFTLPETIRPSFLSYFNLASTDGTYIAKCHVDLAGNIIISKMPSTAKYIGGQAYYWK